MAFAHGSNLDIAPTALVSLQGTRRQDEAVSYAGANSFFLEEERRKGLEEEIEVQHISTNRRRWALRL